MFIVHTRLDMGFNGKLALVGLLSTFWSFATILFLLSVFSKNDTLIEKSKLVRNILPQMSIQRLSYRSVPLSLLQNYVDAFSYEKYTAEEDKLHQLDKMLKKIMAKHYRPRDDAYSFNVTRSDEIPVTRDVPDRRPKECKDRKFNYSSFPTVSVVTPFHNEALTSLVRHVHAILSRTPPRLLMDIILVDDKSNYTYLGDDLQEYFKFLDLRIKILRNKERKGLIVSRLLGADIAQGEVVIFLDAHMEVCEGWVEPLLERINSHSAIVVQPDIVAINANSFELSTEHKLAYRGGFGWDMRHEQLDRNAEITWKRAITGPVSSELFALRLRLNKGYIWFPLQDYLHQIPRTDWGPVAAPVLQGSCIVIRKSYFSSIGRFDPGLEIWGGEHFELSFNVWMTGGRVESVPCSKVGHIFKSFFTYSFGSGGKNYIVAKNCLRVAEVWMDEYKKVVQAGIRAWHNPLPVFSQSDWESIDERRQMRSRRQSKGFDWYLKAVMPEQRIPEDDDIYHGEILNQKTKQCLYVMKDGYIGMTAECQPFVIVPKNNFDLDTSGRLKYVSKCVGIDESTHLLKTQDCPCKAGMKNWPHWSVDQGRLVFSDHFGARCATQATSGFDIHRGLQVVQLQTCDRNRQEQNWNFMYPLQRG